MQTDMSIERLVREKRSRRLTIRSESAEEGIYLEHSNSERDIRITKLPNNNIVNLRNDSFININNLHEREL